ncbi:RNA polymerase, sigma subunit, ECF family [Actinosynnema pretiosum]|nr:RNA polymerase, sigma subunit, ECF family [Actinosynnema pretiosum]
MPEDLLREVAPRVLGALVRRGAGFADAEDAVQEALVKALALPVPPDDLRAWLIAVAWRKLVDRARGDQARRRREEAFAEDVPAEAVPDRDDTLLLLFLCCHPDLPPASAIALTLRAVAGLTTAAIAEAHLLPEATVAQRISRAKRRIRVEPLGDPEARLPQVLHVLYLLFNEGYTHPGRVDLAEEAIRLARAVVAARPDDGEAAGLLSLMLLTHARRPARLGEHGALVPLAEQDRGRWDRELIEEGAALVVRAVSRGRVGQYQLQAAIAALHDDAARAEDTDWPQILAMYGLLVRMTGNPVIALNRAVAASVVHGVEAGFTLVGELEEALAGHHRLDAVKAHLHERAGDREAAVRHYRAAAARTTSTAERQHLLAKAAGLG